MRIVFVEPAGKGGMIHYAWQLSNALAAEGADVTLLTEKHCELAHLPRQFHLDASIDLWDPKPDGNPSSSPMAIAGRKIRRLWRAARYYAAWLRLIRHVRKLSPDVVLLGDVRFPFDLFPLMLLRRNVRYLVDICHNVHPFSAGGSSGGLFDRSQSRRFFYRRIYRLFDLVFVHFERNRQEFLDTFDLPPDRVGRIVHGNEEIFRALRTPDVDAAFLRRSIGLSDDEPVVLFFGTLSRYKGCDVLLRAFPRIRKETAARLVFAGFPFHDFDLGEHQKLARSLGIEEAVTWIPEYIDSGDIAGWMELASVIVFPYRDIYQSGAIHVAQTFGAPIVASAIGAMQDVISDGVSGLLVPPEDATALADALLRVITEPGLAARLGARAAADARGPFSWEANARVILEAVERRAAGRLEPAQSTSG
jgi:glycosyltransferase involved in cell wall biosynthesis